MQVVSVSPASTHMPVNACGASACMLLALLVCCKVAAMHALWSSSLTSTNVLSSMGCLPAGCTTSLLQGTQNAELDSGLRKLHLIIERESSAWEVSFFERVLAIRVLVRKSQRVLVSVALSSGMAHTIKREDISDVHHCILG